MHSHSDNFFQPPSLKPQSTRNFSLEIEFERQMSEIKSPGCENVVIIIKPAEYGRTWEKLKNVQVDLPLGSCKSSD